MHLRHAALALLTVGLFCLLTLEPGRVEHIIREDGPIENLGAGAFLLAAVGGLVVARRSKTAAQRVVATGFGAASFVAFGEEISWGQRIFGLQTPEALAAANAQHEINLHNLQGLHSGTFDATRIFNIACFALLVLVPVACRVLPQARAFVSRFMPAPSLTIAIPGILLTLCTKVAVWTLAVQYVQAGGAPITHCASEIRECASALMLLMFVADWFLALPANAAERELSAAQPRPQLAPVPTRR